MKFIKAHYKVISIGILLLSLIPFVWLSFYSRPCSDDYNFSIDMIRMMEQGNASVFSVLKTAFQTDMSFYRSWNGLYVSGFLQAMQPGAYLGERNYYTGTLVLMLWMFFGTHYFVKTLFKVFEIDHSVMATTVFMYAFFIHGMINTAQGLYWFCGAYDYIPFIFLTMMISALIMRYAYSEGKGIFYIVLSVILSFINSGGNHITAFVNILILAVLTFFLIWKKKKYGSIATLITAIGGFLLVVFAPGTRVRMNEFESGDPITTIIITAKRAMYLVRTQDYMRNGRFLVYVVLLALFAAVIRKNEKIRSLKVNPIILFLLFAMFYCAMLAVPYHAMGTFGAGRIKNIIWMAYMVLIGIWWVYTLIWASAKYPFVEEKLNKIASYDLRPFVVVICILLVLFSKNMFSVIRELSDGTAQKFADQYEERYELMKKYRGSDEIVVVDKIIDSPNLKFDDISSDFNDWRNQSWYAYYLVKTVTNE
jgi:hypothetical protein